MGALADDKRLQEQTIRMFVKSGHKVDDRKLADAKPGMWLYLACTKCNGSIYHWTQNDMLKCGGK